MTRKNKLILVIMFVVGFAIFWWEARTIKLQTLIASFQSLHFGWLILAALIMLLSLMLEGKTLQILLRGRVAYFPYRNALRIPLIEQLFNSITPFSSGGQPAQLIAMMQSGIEAGQASSVLLMKFIIYQMMVLINFVLTMVFGFHEIMTRFKGIAILILAGFTLHVVVIIGLLLVMYQYRLTKKLLSWLTIPLAWFMKPERVQRFKDNMDEKVDTFYAESVHLKAGKKESPDCLCLNASPTTALLLDSLLCDLVFGPDPCEFSQCDCDAYYDRYHHVHLSNPWGDWGRGV